MTEKMMEGLAEVEDPVLSRIGKFGKFQARVIAVVQLVGLFAAWQTLSFSFLLPEVTFWCNPPQLEQTGSPGGNWTSPKGDPCLMYDVDFSKVTAAEMVPLDAGSIACTRWQFSTEMTPESVASQFSLVCANDYQRSLSKSVYMGGKMIGALGSGLLSDKFGRKISMLVASFLLLLSGITITFSPSMPVFIIIRGVVGASSTALFASGFVHALEMVGGTYSTLVSFLLEYSWALGILTVPLLALQWPRWDHLQLACSLPALFFVFLLLFPRLVPESPRWLLAVGRKKEAELILASAAKENGRCETEDGRIALEDKAKNLPKERGRLGEAGTDGQVVKANEEESAGNVFDLFRTPHLRKSTLIMFYLWFTNNLVYYGLTFNLGKLVPGNLHMNMMVSGALEILAYTVAIFAFLKLGRRFSLSSFMAFAGVALLLTQATDNQTAKTVLAQLGKFAITASFAMVWQYGAEIFPTQVRNIGLGSSSFVSRLGSISAPFIGRELGALSPLVPSLIFGITPILGSMLTLLLPETKGRVLPDTIQEGELFCSEGNLQCLQKNKAGK